MSTSIATINNEKLKCRWQETYVSEALNMHTAAMQSGILYGFLISAPSARNIRFSVHAELGLSLARIRTNDVALTYRETADVTFNLASFGGSTIFIGITTTYQTSTTTEGAYIAYSEAEYNAGVNNTIWLCKVNVPGSGSLAIGDIDTSIRSRSWAEYSALPDMKDWSPAVGDPAIVNADSIGDEIGATGDAASDLTTVVSNSVHSLRFRLTGASAGNVYRLLNSVAVIKSLSRCRVRFSLKTAGATAVGAGVYLRYRDSAFTLISSALIGPSLTASTVDWTTYTYETLPPSTACYVEIAAGVTTLSAGTVRIEMVQVWTEASTPYQRGAQLPQVWAPSIKLLSHQDTAKYARFDWIGPDEISLRSVGGGAFSIGDADDGTNNNIDLEVYGGVTAKTVSVDAVTKFWTMPGNAIRAFSAKLVDSTGPGANLDQVATVTLGSMFVQGHLTWGDLICYIPLSIPSGSVLKKFRIYGKFDCTGTPADIPTVAVLVSQSKYPSGTLDVIGSVALTGVDNTDLKCEADLADYDYSPTANSKMLSVYLTIDTSVIGASVYVYGIEVEYQVSGV